MLLSRVALAEVLLGQGLCASPVQRTVPALFSKKFGALDVPANWFCDDHVYCQGGGACCPDFAGGGFLCAGDDAFANCRFDGAYCPGDAPIICGGGCCGLRAICRDGLCYPRTSSNGPASWLHPAAVRRPVLTFAHVKGPPTLGWYPGNWDDGMLRTVEEGLHNQFLEMQAIEWRSTDPKPGQCFVIGFPADLAQCENPWDEGCQGSAATIIQDGDMIFYNKKPILTPTNMDTLSWCNDDPTQKQSYEHDYSYTETQSWEIEVSMGTKITVGMESKTTIEENLLVESGKEEMDFSFKMEVDLDMTKKQTTTKQKQWTVKNTVAVGPRSHVHSTCWLSVGTLDSPYDAKVKINSPIVWACTSPADGPLMYIVPEDRSLWQSFNMETVFKDEFGLSKEDLEGVFSAKIGGTWKGIVGQSVQCRTHTVALKPGEMCNGTSRVLIV